MKKEAGKGRVARYSVARERSKDMPDSFSIIFYKNQVNNDCYAIHES